VATPRKRRTSRSKKKDIGPVAAELSKKLRSIGGVGQHCLVLGIDPAQTSGWALLCQGKLVQSGSVVNAHLRSEVIRLAKHNEVLSGLSLVIVMEDWTAGGWPGHKQMFGMGAARGRWLEQIELAGIPSRRVISVYPQTWRAAIFGTGGSKIKGPQYKAMAVAHARSYFGMGRDPSDDEADALCIARWACAADATVSALKPEMREIVVRGWIPRVYTSDGSS
jgi:hypothetical protein